MKSHGNVLRKQIMTLMRANIEHIFFFYYGVIYCLVRGLNRTMRNTEAIHIARANPASEIRKTQILCDFCQALRGLPVGFLLLRYSVLFTVES